MTFAEFAQPRVTADPTRDYDTPIRLVPKDYQPAAVGVGETIELVRVPKGYRVLWVAVQKAILTAGGSTATITIGDTASANGYVTAGDLGLATGAVGDLVTGSGTFLANSGGKLYNAIDSVKATYTPGGAPGATNPRIRVRIAISREWPST